MGGSNCLSLIQEINEQKKRRNLRRFLGMKELYVPSLSVSTSSRFLRICGNTIIKSKRAATIN